MSTRKSTLWSLISASATTGILGSLASAAVVTFVPMQSAQAQTACAAAWSASSVYTGGNTASKSGINYVANWWTQGDDPTTHNGGAGSGQPWTSLLYTSDAAAPQQRRDPAAPAPISKKKAKSTHQ
ncbi:hypothetical protein EYC46_18655, partial [Pseudoxanthomonas winnipegensis]